MKKITFILFLMFVPFFGISQTFDFTNTDNGWTVLGGFTATNEATSIKLTTKDNTADGSLKNPTFATLLAGIDTSVNSIIGVTLKNNSATGPDFLRVSFLKPSGGRFYKNLDITTGDASFVTYWFDMSNANWTGTMDDIKLHFRAAGNTDYTLPDPQVNIDIDKIEIVATMPTTLREIFNFATDNDTEGFISLNGSLSGPTAGVLLFTPEALKFSKIVQNLHHVNATTNKTATIVFKNNSSANDQLRFVANGVTVTQVITTNDTEAKTYVFDLKNITEWTGDVSFSIGIGINTGDNIGKAADAGTIEFSSIVIDNTVVLSTQENTFTNLSIYPNPAKTFVNIYSENKISKIKLYNIIGKKVLETKTLINKRLDISNLNKGVYFLKVYNTKNKIATHKLIIN